MMSDFVPKMRFVSNITQSETPTVTTTEDHGYEVGNFVRLVVPLAYGMQIEYTQTKILTVPTDSSFTVDYDTRALKGFVTPSAPYTPAQVIPIAGIATDNIAS